MIGRDCTNQQDKETKVLGYAYDDLSTKSELSKQTTGTEEQLREIVLIFSWGPLH